MHPRNQEAYGYSYKGDILNEIKNAKIIFKGNTKFFILKSNTI